MYLWHLEPQLVPLQQLLSPPGRFAPLLEEWPPPMWPRHVPLPRCNTKWIMCLKKGVTHICTPVRILNYIQLNADYNTHAQLVHKDKSWVG